VDDRGRARLGRRARRRALWGLHLRAQVVGHTAAGRPIVAVGTARLVWVGGRYFHWLLLCGNCGRETEWGGVRLSKPAHLRSAPPDILCSNHRTF